MRTRFMFLASVCAALLAAGPAGAVPEPAWTDAEMEHFLLHADIVQVEPLSIGVTGSRRATLSLGGRTHDAHLQTIDVVKHKTRVKGRIVLGFRDSYRYNVAAYRLDRMLGLHMVPVSVLRRIEGEMAAVTWWVDDVLMMERERLAASLVPPKPRSWIQQGHRRRVFNELIQNIDFNQTNILITRDWDVQLIDFTRAFRRHKRLSNPAGLAQIESPLLDRLRQLSREEIESRLGDCLTPAELRPLLARRDAIVECFARAIEERGAAAVIYRTAEELEAAPHAPGSAEPATKSS